LNCRAADTLERANLAPAGLLVACLAALAPLCAAALEGPPPAAAQEEAPELAPADLKLDRYKPGEDGRPQWVGEELEYGIRWHGVPAGRALLKVKRRERFPEPDGPETWLVRLDIRSSRIVSTFHPLRNKTQSQIDVKGGFSRYFSKEQNEGRYEMRERVLPDYALDKLEAGYEFPQPCRATQDAQGRARTPWKKLAIPLNGKVLDPLSAVYRLRSLDLAPGKTIVLPILTERRVWNTRIKVEGRERLEVPALGGSQPCLVLAPECQFNGLFERRGPLRIWVHEATKVVVKLAAETPIGACEALLEAHRNSPLNAAE
jgi:hypothetical protein